MLFNKQNLDSILAEVKKYNATLVAVSKTKPAEAVKAVFQSGHPIFGENYVQELLDKSGQLPPDIQWHFIGHLQTNKVKQLAGFISLIQSVDSLKLIQEINKQAAKNNRTIDCLLEIHIASEETKFGLSIPEVETLLNESEQLPHVKLRGLMGMASLTGEEQIIRSEFQSLRKLFEQLKKDRHGFDILSMGMTSDYRIALEEGSTMIRIGSAIFGSRSL